MFGTKIPLLVGSMVEILGIVFASYLIYVAPDVSDITLRFLLYLFASGAFVFFPHCLAHFVVGRLVGIRFTGYSLGKSSVTKLRMPLVSDLASLIPILTLRIDRRSLRLASRGARAAMFGSGAATSMTMPFFVVAASFRHLPTSLTLLLAILAAANLMFDLYYSPKAGDLSRIRVRK